MTMEWKGISQLGHHFLLILLLTVALRPTLSQMGTDEPLNLTSWITRMKKNEQQTTTSPLLSTPKQVTSNKLCHHCFIVMVTLATVAAIFMVTTVILCSKMLVLSRYSSRVRIKARAQRRTPTQGLWIEQRCTMKERTESWYKDDTRTEKRQDNKSLRRTSNGGMSLWIPSDTSMEERSLLWYRHGSKESRIANGNMTHPKWAENTNSIQPRVTLDQISGFWHGNINAWETTMSHGGTTSFQGCSQSSTRTDLGQDSSTTEEQEWKNSTITEKQGYPEDLGENQEHEEEEFFPIVQPRVTLQEISEFWSHREARHSQMGQSGIENNEAESRVPTENAYTPLLRIE
ncbi:transmembrane protein C16orf54 homolog [Microcaecilia unicolor]|uniref:Uncharacterized protein LOC115474168 n=1 Tax=Microcaecilia unicolor TaxID=1415580 RepID=A0A6P7YK67_9AMPH|nr:uncharacterized protein LOC115474168 [Microcaecilia unicolor]